MPHALGDARTRRRLDAIAFCTDSPTTQPMGAPTARSATASILVAAARGAPKPHYLMNMRPGVLRRDAGAFPARARPRRHRRHPPGPGRHRPPRALVRAASAGARGRRRRRRRRRRPAAGARADHPRARRQAPPRAARPAGRARAARPVGRRRAQGGERPRLSRRPEGRVRRHPAPVGSGARCASGSRDEARLAAAGTGSSAACARRRRHGRRRRLPRPGDGRGGIEVFAGVKRDPAFGLVLAFGIGGVRSRCSATWRCARCRSARATRRRWSPRSGARRCSAACAGGRPADVAALVRCSRRSATSHGRTAQSIAEIDLNPIKVLPAGRRAASSSTR